MLRILIKRMMAVLIISAWTQACASNQLCGEPPDHVLSEVECNLKVNGTWADLGESYFFVSKYSPNIGVLTGEIEQLQLIGIDKFYTYGIWLIDFESNEIMAATKNAEIYSTFPKISNETEIRLYESGDLKNARKCIEN